MSIVIIFFALILCTSLMARLLISQLFFYRAFDGDSTRALPDIDKHTPSNVKIFRPRNLQLNETIYNSCRIKEKQKKVIGERQMTVNNVITRQKNKRNKKVINITERQKT